MRVLIAWSLTEARSFRGMFADSIIIRTNDGEWIDEPLCLDRRKRLGNIHGIRTPNVRLERAKDALKNVLGIN